MLYHSSTSTGTSCDQEHGAECDLSRAGSRVNWSCVLTDRGRERKPQEIMSPLLILILFSLSFLYFSLSLSFMCKLYVLKGFHVLYINITFFNKNQKRFYLPICFLPVESLRNFCSFISFSLSSLSSFALFLSFSFVDYGVFLFIYQFCSSLSLQKTGRNFFSGGGGNGVIFLAKYKTNCSSYNLINPEKPL